MVSNIREWPAPTREKGAMNGTTGVPMSLGERRCRSKVAIFLGLLTGSTGQKKARLYSLNIGTGQGIL